MATAKKPGRATRTATTRRKSSATEGSKTTSTRARKAPAGSKPTDERARKTAASASRKPSAPRKADSSATSTTATTSVATSESAASLTIEELAQKTGYTVRNLRAFQGRGLLDKPILRGRKGFYGPSHLGRVAMIRRLQDRGYSLAAIADTVHEWAGRSEPLDDLHDALITPAADDRELSETDVLALLPDLATQPAIRDALVEIGLLQRRGDAFVAPSATLIEVARLYRGVGFPWEKILTEVTSLRAEAARVAEVFRRAFDRNFFVHLYGGDIRNLDLAELARIVRLLRPATTSAFTALLAQEIERGGPRLPP